ncbi:potassium transporter [Rhodocyclus tenuis]|uniref:Potassium transporter n=2 Tax=Rhodocyclus TaxID=1064 RepID=A0A6L5JU38_RHOTE|nr:cation:proton antiporter [Rhodocyclus gracilis]MQY50616.1 potassium transporter [Rhodocyclus gracilis]MRD72620.1 potassium transporter [Rhodocyclus gracilis]NJA88146.1 potassium transporter [Rhodocyclus gracilis]
MPAALQSLLVLLASAVAALALARVLRLPSMLAYLSVGIALGPHGAAYFAENEQVSSVAEFGIVFLMFSIGLEFSLSRLKAMRHMVFGLGAAQLLVTLAGTMAVTIFFYGQEWRVGFAIGAACAMSSTAIVAKLLSERLELHSRPGQQTMAVLLFQDLAVAPLLIVLAALGKGPEALAETLTLAMAQTVLVLAVIVLVGQRLIRRWFDLVAGHKSPELFMLNVLLVVVGLSLATSAAGLSLALGAFLGGMLIAETPYRHQVEADIRPFRDVLLGLFFVTVGMMLDLGFVLAHLPQVLMALALFIGAKGGLMLLLTLLLRNPLDVGLRTAAQLAQAGEFGLVLLQLASDSRLLPADAFQVTIAAMLLSMFLAPFLIARAAHVGKRLSGSEFAHRAEAIHDIAVHAMDIREHVIVCGYGRTGQSVARFLSREQIPFIALDIDTQRFRQAQDEGENVVFGAADRREVLMAAGIARARAVVITYAEQPATEAVLDLLRSVRPEVPVIVRTQDDTQIDRLKSLGATEVVPEVVEGSLMLAAHTLSQLGVPIERAIQQVRATRAERYASLRAFYRSESDRQRDRQSADGDALRRQIPERLSVVVEAQSYAVGRSLADLDLGRFGVSVDALRRGGVRGDDPDPATRVLGADVLVLVGATENLSRAEQLLHAGPV